jgi:hypothetical protein
MLEVLKPSLLRGAVYLGVLGLGSLAALAAAMGVGTYDADTGLYSLTVHVETAVTYLVAMIGGSGLSLTALLKGWRK